jgi:phosphoribosylformimino-5-aminoimidazole carboxamide ribotide isomerase
VGFEVIPAVDVADGRLARATAGGVTAVRAFGSDPVAAARAFVDAGAARLHVVDIGLALTGVPANLHVLREIAALGVPVQASGGVVSKAQIDSLLEAGADRVVLGSAALADRPAVEAFIASAGDSLAVGIEAGGARILPREGPSVDLPLWETLEWLATLDVRRFVLTEVGRVGGLAGPDLDGIWALATQTGKPTIAAGGIRGVDDLRAVAALDGSVSGAIIGRALYEGLDLGEALAALA